MDVDVDGLVDSFVQDLMQHPTVDGLTEMLAICLTRAVNKSGSLDSYLLGADYDEHLFVLRQVADKLCIALKDLK